MSGYQEIVDYILSIPKFAAKTGTDNLTEFMNQMGNPHNNYKSIHVAGTNGKGSVSTFMKELLINSGYRVGVFTSPHLINITERMSIDRNDITREDFISIFKQIKKLIDKRNKEGKSHPSFFEVVFLMAAVWFSEQKVDYAIFETGMGGRFDATNIIMPEVSIITSIGLDHTKYLGDSISEIAYEKAGIIKTGVPVIINTNSKEADEVIIKEAIKKDAPIYSVEKNDYIISELSDKTIDFSIHSSYYKYDKLQLNGQPIYQVENFATALLAYYTMFGYCTENVITISLGNFKWQGRMEYIAPNIIVDGAHNEDAIKQFVRTLNSQYEKTNKQLLFAVADDKDYTNMIKVLTEEVKFNRIYITALSSQRGISSNYIKSIFDQYCNDTTIEASDDIKEIFIKAKDNLNNDMLFVVGSLYLVGQIKGIYEEEYND